MDKYTIDAERFNVAFPDSLRRQVAAEIAQAISGMTGVYAEQFWSRLGSAYNRNLALPEGIPCVDDLFPPNIAVLDWLMMMNVSRTFRILDVACGLGNLAFYLKRLGYADLWGHDNWMQIGSGRVMGFQSCIGSPLYIADSADTVSSVDVVVCVGFVWDRLYGSIQHIVGQAKYVLVDTSYAPPDGIPGFELVGSYERLLNVYQNKTFVQLHLGCGKRCLPGFIHVDLADFPHIDYRHDIRTLPMFADDSVDLVYACHVLEYFDRVEVVDVLKEWRRVLKPNGVLRLAVPDIDALILVYLTSNELGKILGPLYGRWSVGDLTLYHKTVYNVDDLTALLESCGFVDVHIYDWRRTIHRNFDDYSQAYYPHMQKETGVLISLNVECCKDSR